MQVDNNQMLQLGLNEVLLPYCPYRVYKDDLKSLLIPGEYADWMCLNLYLQLLVTDQNLKIFNLDYVPWDLIDVRGFSSEVSVSDVMERFSESPFFYPVKWVGK